MSLERKTETLSRHEATIEIVGFQPKFQYVRNESQPLDTVTIIYPQCIDPKHIKENKPEPQIKPPKIELEANGSKEEAPLSKNVQKRHFKSVEVQSSWAKIDNFEIFDLTEVALRIQEANPNQKYNFLLFDESTSISYPKSNVVVIIKDKEKLNKLKEVIMPKTIDTPHQEIMDSEVKPSSNTEEVNKANIKNLHFQNLKKSNFSIMRDKNQTPSKDVDKDVKQREFGNIYNKTLSFVISNDDEEETKEDIPETPRNSKFEEQSPFGQGSLSSEQMFSATVMPTLITKQKLSIQMDYSDEEEEEETEIDNVSGEVVSDIKIEQAPQESSNEKKESSSDESSSTDSSLFKQKEAQPPPKEQNKLDQEKAVKLSPDVGYSESEETEDSLFPELDIPQISAGHNREINPQNTNNKKKLLSNVIDPRNLENLKAPSKSDVEIIPNCNEEPEKKCKSNKFHFWKSKGKKKKKEDVSEIVKRTLKYEQQFTSIEF